MTRHLSRRPPHKCCGFSWGRFPLGDGGPISYRLFRRDQGGVLHMAMLDFSPATPRSAIARALRPKCRQLRDCVDEIDLVLMEAA